MVLAARLRGVPAALTEADAHLGLANRLAAPFAKRLFLAYEIPGRNSARVRVVGRPIPVAHLVGSRESGRELFGLPPTGPVVGVFGAYVGALSINEMAVEAWAAAGPAVIHQAGERDFARVTSRVARDDYVVIEATDDFGELLRCVDLAVSRAGGTVWELAAAGTPAILVPYPYATADHQTLNARHFERGGGAIVVPDADVDRVPALVHELLAAPERLAAMRRAMLSLARPDAAGVIADELVALAEEREASVS
jgi:UDP-N-acetylglucosamine--N-acetylmuramyl-(pentapeptide) pyrophosphoryl-undecaprenol N-acetylglucosamine transferase